MYRKNISELQRKQQGKTSEFWVTMRNTVISMEGKGRLNKNDYEIQVKYKRKQIIVKNYRQNDRLKS